MKPGTELKKNIASRLFGLLLLGFSAGLWAWMLGCFARSLPLGSLEAFSLPAAWITPGTLPYPMIVSVVAALVGMLYVVVAIPFPRDPDTVESK